MKITGRYSMVRSFLIDDKDLELLKKIAKEQDRSVNYLVAKIIKDFLSNCEVK